MDEEHVAWQGDGTWQEYVLVDAEDLVSLCLPSTFLYMHRHLAT